MDIQRFEQGHPKYPAVFKQLTDPPKQIFVRGQIDLLQPSDRPVVGIVGTRRADPTARRLAREVASRASDAGCLVVSGLALGVDAEAHQGALPGKTVAVLGSGLADHIITPQQHLGLAHQILNHRGLLLSEYPETYPAGKYTYPARNRLIAALCTHLIVVQAPIGSGALITVDHALALGRNIASFPGPSLNPGWRGSNQLLKEGADVLCEPADVLSWLGIDSSLNKTLEMRMSEAEQLILKILTAQSCTTQELIARTHLDVASLTSYLGQLELAGCIQQSAGVWSLA